MIKGSAPSLSVSIDPATNRITGTSYDANGNNLSAGSYDSYNRLLQGTDGTSYDYAPDNKRVASKTSSGTVSFYFWTPDGQRFGTYQASGNGLIAVNTNIYFGGRLISAQGTPVLVDRLGSNVSGGRRYFPYGEEKGTATANGIEKYATYFRDPTGLDYADQRYYSNSVGRFLTPDPLDSSAQENSPASWNRYLYVLGDPINRTDPRGLCSTDGNGNYWDDPGAPCTYPITVSTPVTTVYGCTGGMIVNIYGQCDWPINQASPVAVAIGQDLSNAFFGGGCDVAQFFGSVVTLMYGPWIDASAGWAYRGLGLSAMYYSMGC